MGNFIDKTFTVIADILLKVLPASKQEKQAFSYYRAGMSAQGKGRYAEALKNYYEALQVEEDPYDRSYTLYNIGLIYGNTGKYTQAVEFYHQALALNSNLPQALNNIAVIYHSQALRAQTVEDDDLSKELFDKASEYWIQALKLAPDNYPGARNWLKVTGRFMDNNY
jgi:tetratricopeptide (TPR) repeat protein|uniref:photosystem I assembly protein Ycf3 n=1 Tax=Pseudo-nitzschia americana TaxID=44446 RepID=UPI001D1297AD|nr:photosystem I assembly protein Ycf3 [Pseudo-nitzschia americana]UBA15081.1 photosystem I assembly protein Ycf3 [Pseudo-nitzschia americana]